VCVCVCGAWCQFLRLTLLTTLLRVVGGCCPTVTVTSVIFRLSSRRGLQAVRCPTLLAQRQPMVRHGHHTLSALSVLTTTWQLWLLIHGLMVFIAVMALIAFRYYAFVSDPQTISGIFCSYINKGIETQHLNMHYLQSVCPQINWLWFCYCVPTAVNIGSSELCASE